jgi:hypothetical protein
MPRTPSLIENERRALTYKSALGPVMTTVLGKLGADALFFWELFDEEDKAPKTESRWPRSIHKYEKERLCTNFYRFLAEKQRGLLNEVVNHKPEAESHRAAGTIPTTPESSSATASEIQPENMPKLLEGNYSILKFVLAITNEKTLQPLEFRYGEEARPRKYVVRRQPPDRRLPEEDVELIRKFDEKIQKLRFIKYEGVTAYHARLALEDPVKLAKMSEDAFFENIGVYSKSELSEELRELSIGLNHDRLEMRREDGRLFQRCEHLCILPIIHDNDVIGLLKAERYNSQNPFTRNDLVDIKSLLKYVADFIVESRKGVHALTYSQLCKGKAILKPMIELQKQIHEMEKNGGAVRPVIKEVVERLAHVFHVFQRDTYIGRIGRTSCLFGHGSFRPNVT